MLRRGRRADPFRGLPDRRTSNPPPTRTDLGACPDLLLKARNRRGKVVVQLEHRIELRHLEQLADLRAGVDELRLAAFLLRVGQSADEGAQAGAVQEPDALQVDEEVDLALLQEARHGLLEGGLGLADDEVSVKGQYRDPIVLRSFQI